MHKTDKGLYTLKNPQKYIGDPTRITFRSSWENSAMQLFDGNPSIEHWSSEPLQIPYMHPLKNAWSIYVPDFFLIYTDKKGQRHVELVEVKPIDETPGYQKISERTGKAYRISKAKRAAQAINACKFAAATVYCQKRGWTFRVLTEVELFGYKR